MSGDHDPPDMFQVETRTAHKQHVCYECGDQINAGDKYTVTSGKWSQEFARYKECGRCTQLALFAKDLTGENPPIGDLHETLMNLLGEYSLEDDETIRAALHRLRHGEASALTAEEEADALYGAIMGHTEPQDGSEFTPAEKEVRDEEEARILGLLNGAETVFIDGGVLVTIDICPKCEPPKGGICQHCSGSGEVSRRVCDIGPHLYDHIRPPKPMPSTIKDRE